jgi:KDO2-lipid IV(A) lauroyltransferase
VPRPSLKHRVEYYGLRAIAALATWLPYRAALCFGWLIAALLFHVFRFRRRATLERIGAVLAIHPNSREARRIAWVSLRNLAFNAIEMMRVRDFTVETMRDLIPNLPDAMRQMRGYMAEQEEATGAIIAVPHMGNWDLAGSACYLEGLPIFSVAARQRNPLTNDFINQLRSGHGMDILERGSGTLRQVIQRLREGQLFAILPDTRSRHPDLEIEFLGGVANLARGMASFARAAKVPVVTVIMRRVGWSQFHITLHPPVLPDLTSDKTADLQRMTQHVVSIIDAAIREHPEQWFWYNKRWVLDPL